MRILSNTPDQEEAENLSVDYQAIFRWLSSVSFLSMYYGVSFGKVKMTLVRFNLVLLSRRTALVKQLRCYANCVFKIGLIQTSLATYPPVWFFRVRESF